MHKSHSPFPNECLLNFIRYCFRGLLKVRHLAAYPAPKLMQHLTVLRTDSLREISTTTERYFENWISNWLRHLNQPPRIHSAIHIAVNLQDFGSTTVELSWFFFLVGKVKTSLKLRFHEIEPRSNDESGRVTAILRLRSEIFQLAAWKSVLVDGSAWDNGEI